MRRARVLAEEIEEGVDAVNRTEQLVHGHLFEHAPILGALLDRDLRLVAANGRFRQVFPRWRGRHCFEVLVGRATPCATCHARRAIEDGRVHVVQARLTLPGQPDAMFVTRVAPVSGPGTDERTHVIWMASDVNEAESLQRENELLFEHVPCYITVLDRQLRIVRANRRMRETFGGRRGEQCYRVYKRRESPCPQCPALAALEDGREHSSRQVGVTATGGEAHYMVTAAALSAAGNPGERRVEHVIEMSIDVTRQDELQAEVVEAERLAAVGQTVAGLAHGIKNILMGIEGGVYVMGSGLRRGQAPRLGRGLEMLERNVGKMSSLVTNLLAFAKGTTTQVCPSDLNEVAREVIELYREMAGGIGVELRGEMQEGIPAAPLDPSGIHTCIANLVSNAIDACKASASGTGHVIVRTSERDGILRVEVVDDGSGIDDAVREKIFTTFFTTKGAGGTGLGLLMTRKIVHEHGGRVEVESSAGHGTAFRILLPRARLPRLSSQGDTPPNPAS